MIYGVWLVPAVLGGLVIRKPGAALFTARPSPRSSPRCSAPSWGWTLIVQGPLQGLGAELAFAAFRYRSYRLPVALLAGALAGLGAALFDVFVWYAELRAGPATGMPVRRCSPCVSAAVIAGARQLAADPRPGPDRRAGPVPRRPRTRAV